jgi:putative PIN family toxin of toxin-antitoxin system
VLVVLDSNVFLSALLSGKGLPARAVDAWRAGRFELVTSREQIDELKRAARYEKVRNLVSRAAVGRLVNSLRNAEMLLARLPRASAASDPGDDYLLAMSAAADADYLVTGDKALLSLGQFAATRIITLRRFAALLAR